MTETTRINFVSGVKNHSVGLLLILSLIVSFKFGILWAAIVFTWSVGAFVYRRLPGTVRDNLHKRLPAHFATEEKLRQNSWVQQLSEAVEYTRPFILFWLYIFCIPFALIWMSLHWCKNVIAPSREAAKQIENGSELLVFTQNRQREAEGKTSGFFLSPAFPLTALALFGTGIPAIITYGIYQTLKMDSIFGAASADPQYLSVIFGIDFYLTSLCWCLCVFFFRAWMTFPLNFLSLEHEVELNSTWVKRRPYKGWFLSAVMMNSPAADSRLINWSEVHRVNARNATGAMFYPLPATSFGGPDSPVYRLFNKVARLYDSVSRKIDHSQYISISTAPSLGSFGYEMDINLADLSVADRARLFYAIGKWAPHAIVSAEAQERMIGSRLLKETKYTEIWFDLLTQKQERNRLSELSAGDKLRAGDVEIIERIASGGQATAYLARYKGDRLCVVKEFVLSDSDAVGALVESAREFEVETTILSQLDHPRIVKMIDFFAEDRRAYICLEYIEGQSLRRMVKDGGALPEAKVIEIALQLAEAVSYLHRQSPPLIHRDLAPDNVIYHSDHGVTLIDFSLACAPSTDGASAGSASGSVGKNAYTPPEQFRCEETLQSDLYTLGATLHYLLTGADPRPLAASVPASVNPAVSAELSAIVEQATALEPAHRHESVDWFKLELESLRAPVA